MAQRDMLPVLCSCLESALRPDFYGFPYRALSEQFKRKRHHVMWACVFEMIFCAFSLPLAAIRGGISKASTAINVVLLIIAFWGLIASTRADFVWMAAHSALVFGILGIFTIYVFLTIAFGAGDSGNLIVFLVFAFCVIDVVIACMTANFSWAIYVEKRRLEGMDAAAIAAAANPPAGRVELGVPVALPAGKGPAEADAKNVAAQPGQPGARGAATHDGKGSARVATATAAAARPAQPAAAAGGDPADAGNNQEECVVCMENPRNAWLYRCGHNVVCMECGNLLKTNGENCPVCRQPINDVVRKY